MWSNCGPDELRKANRGGKQHHSGHRHVPSPESEGSHIPVGGIECCTFETILIFLSNSNPGGTDEATVYAWEAALNLTQVFAGLKEYDLMSPSKTSLPSIPI